MFSSNLILFRALAKISSFIFFRVGFSRWQKNKCAVCAVAFLVQIFDFSSIFALLTTSGYQ